MSPHFYLALLKTHSNIIDSANCPAILYDVIKYISKSPMQLAKRLRDKGDLTLDSLSMCSRCSLC